MLPSFFPLNQAAVNFWNNIQPSILYSRACEKITYAFYQLMQWGEAMHWKILSSCRLNSHRVSHGHGNTLAYNPNFKSIAEDAFRILFNADKFLENHALTGFNQIEKKTLQDRLTKLQEEYFKLHHGRENAFQQMMRLLKNGTCHGQTAILLENSHLFTRLSVASMEELLVQKIESVFVRQMFLILRYEIYQHDKELSRPGSEIDHDIQSRLFPDKQEQEFVDITESAPTILCNQLASYVKCSGTIQLCTGHGRGTSVHVMDYFVDTKQGKCVIVDSNSGSYEYSDIAGMCQGIKEIAEARNRSPFIPCHRKAVCIQFVVFRGAKE